jgi:hypothetical protein
MNGARTSCPLEREQIVLALIKTDGVKLSVLRTLADKDVRAP